MLSPLQPLYNNMMPLCNYITSVALYLIKNCKTNSYVVKIDLAEAPKIAFSLRRHTFVKLQALLASILCGSTKA